MSPNKMSNVYTVLYSVHAHIPNGIVFSWFLGQGKPFDKKSEENSKKMDKVLGYCVSA